MASGPAAVTWRDNYGLGAPAGGYRPTF